MKKAVKAKPPTDIDAYISQFLPEARAVLARVTCSCGAFTTSRHRYDSVGVPEFACNRRV